MPNMPEDERSPLPGPRLLAAAPHRPLFLAGALAVLLAMAWWTIWLAAGPAGFAPPQPATIPAGWIHAVIMQYGVFPPFIFGFLITVFPKWMNLDAVPPWQYLPVAGGLFGGYVLMTAGAFGSAGLVLAGLALSLAGWLAGLVVLGRLLARGGFTDRYALSTYCALLIGFIGLAAFAGWAAGGSWRLAFFAIKAGTFGLLLPVYFTVCHRMIPFFSSRVIPDYQVRRPVWGLAVLWYGVLAHLALEMVHGHHWLWLPDGVLAAAFAWHAMAWQPWRSRGVGLLWVLHAAFLWAPLAFLLYTLQSAWLLFTGEFVLGRAPMHALGVGFFGSMLVAMVTRVTQGHSGRPLAMVPVAWLAFAGIQLTALLRIAAEILPHGAAWMLASAVVWLAAFLPWVARSARVYLAPRADARPG